MYYCDWLLALLQMPIDTGNYRLAFATMHFTGLNHIWIKDHSLFSWIELSHISCVYFYKCASMVNSWTLVVHVIIVMIHQTVYILAHVYADEPLNARHTDNVLMLLNINY